ncbi:MAG: DNA primase [Chlorobi bacterium]|nr:DNA primase [Chlorobiota bacterium]
MRIPENKIEEIRNLANIVDVISTYVHLKKQGKTYAGLCPFHNDKNPSLKVSEEKQIYKCFVCNAGGNVFNFLMQYKSISFIEAVQEVAEHLGVKLELEKGSSSIVNSELEELYDVNVTAAKYFSNNLLNSRQGEIAREYFKKRNIKTQTQKMFGLGYAFSEWEHFLHYAEEKNVNLAKAMQLGLIDKRNDGSYYDKYRGRIIFPIFSPNGRIIGFGGRILNNAEKAAKYLNSPESPVYLKRKTLYGLFHSKDEIRKLNKAILVEGYMDLIALFQNGVKNVVASSGTSLTEEQIKLLSRFTKNIVVIYDADSAGQHAAMRSIELLLKEDFEVRIVALPEGEDPDSFINQYGKKDFDELVKQADNFLEYQMRIYQQEGKLDSPESQAEVVRELVKSVALIEDELKRNLMIKSISKKFDLREVLVESELDKLLNKKDSQKKRYAGQNPEAPIPHEAEKIKTITRIEAKFEEEIIRLLFEGVEEIQDLIFDNIMPDDLHNPDYRKLSEIALENYRNDIVSPSGIIEKIEDDNLRNIALSLTLNDISISAKHGEEITSAEVTKKNALRYASDVIKKFRITKINEEIENNKIKIKNSETDDNVLELLRLNKELEEEKKAIREENILINEIE